MQAARTSVLAAPCHGEHVSDGNARRQAQGEVRGHRWKRNVLREVYVEEVEVERGLHETCGDGDGVDHVLGEVSAERVSTR